MGRHSDNSLQKSPNHTILLTSPTNAIPKDSRQRVQQFMQYQQYISTIATLRQALSGGLVVGLI